MQEKLLKGKDIIKSLFNNGYEAYFVGEAVRNKIMQRDIDNVSIITNGTVSDIRRIFIDSDDMVTKYDQIDQSTVLIEYKHEMFHISSFDLSQNNFIANSRTAKNRHYSNNLMSDLSSKNFTINAIAMSASGKIIDSQHGVTDIQKKNIKCVTAPKKYFTDNPIEILTALGLVSQLDFSLDSKTKIQMKRKAKLLTHCDKFDVLEKMKVILSGRKAKKALSILVGLGCHKYLEHLTKPIKCLVSSFKFKKVDVQELLLLAFIMKKQIDESYAPIIQNFEILKKTYFLALANPKAKYDKLTLFSNGRFVCLEANYLNWIMGKSRLKTKKIKEQFKALPLKSYCSMAYKGEDILKITDDVDVKIIETIIDDVVFKILNNELVNKYDDIEAVVLKKLTELGIYYDLERKSVEYVPRVKEDDEPKSNDIYIEENSDEINEIIETESDDFRDHRLKILEERLDAQDRMLKEKAEMLKELEKQKIRETVSKLVNSARGIITKDSAVNSMIEDEDEFNRELREFLIKYFNKGETNEEN